MRRDGKRGPDRGDPEARRRKSGTVSCNVPGADRDRGGTKRDNEKNRQTGERERGEQDRDSRRREGTSEGRPVLIGAPPRGQMKKNAIFFYFFCFPPVSPPVPGVVRCFLVFFDCFCACAIFSGIC